jgi:hypothetical protein
MLKIKDIRALSGSTDSIDYVATDSADLTSQAIDDVERGANDSDWQPAEAAVALAPPAKAKKA